MEPLGAELELDSSRGSSVSLSSVRSISSRLSASYFATATAVRAAIAIASCSCASFSIFLPLSEVKDDFGIGDDLGVGSSDKLLGRNEPFIFHESTDKTINSFFSTSHVDLFLYDTFSRIDIKLS